MSRILRSALALAATAAIAGACASGGTAAPSPTSAPTTAAPTRAAVNIDVQGFKFPANMDVAKGTKVSWTNKDTTKHTVTSGTRPTKDGTFDGQLDASTGTFSFTFTEAGTYQYFCTLHSSMNATITVK